jgi:hypothetical protein
MGCIDFSVVPLGLVMGLEVDLAYNHWQKVCGNASCGKQVKKGGKEHKNHAVVEKAVGTRSKQTCQGTGKLWKPTRF